MGYSSSCASSSHSFQSKVDCFSPSQTTLRSTHMPSSRPSRRANPSSRLLRTSTAIPKPLFSVSRCSTRSTPPKKLASSFVATLFPRISSPLLSPNLRRRFPMRRRCSHTSPAKSAVRSFFALFLTTILTFSSLRLLLLRHRGPPLGILHPRPQTFRHLLRTLPSRRSLLFHRRHDSPFGPQDPLHHRSRLRCCLEAVPQHCRRQRESFYRRNCSAAHR
jgi:hypothetical protein